MIPCQKAKQLAEIIIATTKNREDDILCDEAREQNVSVFRGDEHDVLAVPPSGAGKRCGRNCSAYSRLPINRWKLIDEALSQFLASDFDYLVM